MLVVPVYMVLAIWQLVFGSWIIKRVGRGLVDGGWIMGRIGGWLTTALIVWFLAHLGLAVNSIWGIRAIVWVVTLIGIQNLWKTRHKVRAAISEKKWLILAEEVLFALGLVWLTWVRGHNAQILDLEKFMDAGFIQGYLRSPRLPAMDMWLAGEQLNYYTFGHFMGAVMTQIWGIDLAYSYNLLLGVIMGLTLAGSFSVVVNLLSALGEMKNRQLVIGGLAGAMVMGFGGNSHTIWFWLKNHTWQGYWYADATRFIYNTIHEFPAYSFIVSDLHGHVWDLPIVLTFLVAAIGWWKGRGYGWAAVLGGLLGVMSMTNMWDALIYSGLVGLVMILDWWKQRTEIRRRMMSLIIMVGMAALVGLPWWLNFVGVGYGVKMVQDRSPIWQLMVLWTGQAIVAGIAIWRWKKNPLVLAMGVMIIGLLIVPELVFVKDIYPNHPRANTMFKLTYQAFVMMSILGGCLMGGVGRWWAISVATVVIACQLTFPYFAYRDYYGGLKNYVGIDGMAWMARDEPEDYQAIAWMKHNIKGRPVILEAVGESYTKHGRVAVFTGLPTVLGWRVHEWLWRGSFDIPGQRTEEARLIFEQPRSGAAAELIDRYKIKYVFLGRLEREAYQVDEKNVGKLGKTVFQSGKTKVVELTTID